MKLSFKSLLILLLRKFFFLISNIELSNNNNSNEKLPEMQLLCDSRGMDPIRFLLPSCEATKYLLLEKSTFVVKPTPHGRGSRGYLLWYPYSLKEQSKFFKSDLKLILVQKITGI